MRRPTDASRNRTAISRQWAPCTASGRCARAGRLPVPAAAGLLAAWVLFALPAALADVIHLKNGGVVEGDILERTETTYRVRTSVGTVSLPVDAVERIEPRESPLVEYARRKAQAADTPADQTALAEWCESVGLGAERRRHLQRAIELDPDYEPARLALGFVRIGGLWVDGRAPEKPSPASAPASAPAASRPADSEEDARLVAAVQSDWFRRIRAIRSNLLEGSSERLLAEGRRRILEIRDPLAILPLTRVLSTGPRAAREVLVEALAQFPQDEATLNLAVLALLDDDEGVRRRALTELLRRQDPRVIPQFREALYTNSDKLIRRAAIALGTLQAAAAIPDLIDVLTAQRRRIVEVPVYIASYERSFDTISSISLGGLTSVRYRPSIGVVFNPSVFADTALAERDVTVFRTEVLEALKAITGQNFGFDAAAWRRWYEEQNP